MSMILHAGGELISYDALKEVPTPEATATHVPLAHHRLASVVKHFLSYYGHEVVEEHHAIAKEGMRYFGLLTLKSNYGDYTDTLIMRNSNDKSFPIGLGFGSRVFVCDNLAFVADHVVKRKHTARSKHELPALISELVEPLGQERERQHKVISRYKATSIGQQLADHAIMELYRQGVLNVTKIADVVEQWERPTHDWQKGTAWHLFNATTFALTGKVAEQPALTTTLHSVMDNVIEMA